MLKFNYSLSGGKDLHNLSEESRGEDHREGTLEPLPKKTGRMLLSNGNAHQLLVQLVGGKREGGRVNDCI